MFIITDQKLVSDNVWHSNEMPPPLNKAILKFWKEEELMGLVKEFWL